MKKIVTIAVLMTLVVSFDWCYGQAAGNSGPGIGQQGGGTTLGKQGSTAIGQQGSTAIGQQGTIAPLGGTNSLVPGNFAVPTNFAFPTNLLSGSNLFGMSTTNMFGTNLVVTITNNVTGETNSFVFGTNGLGGTNTLVLTTTNLNGATNVLVVLPMTTINPVGGGFGTGFGGRGFGAAAGGATNIIILIPGR